VTKGYHRNCKPFAGFYQPGFGGGTTVVTGTAKDLARKDRVDYIAIEWSNLPVANPPSGAAV
jgi:hypothetical protein